MLFRVGIPPEYLGPDGRPVWTSLGIDELSDVPGLEVCTLGERTRHVTPRLLRDLDAIISGTPHYTDESFAGVERLVLVARHGVGYDTIDTDAATRAGVLVTITRGAPDRPVAEGALTLMLALGHQVVNKDRIVREGRWAEKRRWPGVELRDRVVGIIGLGGIGRELARLLRPFGLDRLLVFDPYVDREAARCLGVESVPLDALLAESDFVSIHCPLTPETRHLIGTRELARMKPSAFLVNTARGGIIDQDALVDALRSGSIRGAALDVFREEPCPADDPLTSLDNVILTPHSVAVTEEMYRDYHRVCAAQVLAVMRGEIPPHVVNPGVLGTPLLQAKLDRLRSPG